MGRAKEKKGSNKTFFLADDTIDYLRRLSSIADMSMSAYLDWLVSKAYRSSSTSGQIEEVRRDIERLECVENDIKIQKSALNKKLGRLAELSEMLEKHRNFALKEKSNQKDKLVLILVRKLEDGIGFMELERLAKYHSSMLDGFWSCEELLTEAYIKKKKKEGV